jgi:hypothetical protein
MSCANYSLYLAFAGAMAAMCSSSNTKAQSTIAPPKCVSGVVVQASLGYNMRFHNNCGYKVTVYWGPRVSSGGGLIKYSVDILNAGTTEGEASGSTSAETRYYSCPALNYKLTYLTNLGATVTSYNDGSELVCVRRNYTE